MMRAVPMLLLCAHVSSSEAHSAHMAKSTPMLLLQLWAATQRPPSLLPPPLQTLHPKGTNPTEHAVGICPP
eukprot:483193-Pelagomonas_calceolata.AAC.5